MDEIFAFGSNGCGQLAIGHNDDVQTPTRCNSDCMQSTHGPYRAAFGGNHTLLLDSDGTAFASGNISDGRAGVAGSFDDDDGSATFVQVGIEEEASGKEVTRFRFIAASWEASTLVSSSGHLYTCGTGNKGELGHGIECARVRKAKILKDFPPAHSYIVDISSSMRHTLVVLSDGDVFGWGNGRKGQLGRPAAIVWRPRKIEGIPFKACRAVCGRDLSFVVGDAADGQFAVLGSDSHQLRSSAPHSVAKWKQIGASWCSLYVLLENGTILSWGRNDHGQLAPLGLPLLDSFAAGSEHVLAKSVDGKILAWGWGEHGNCGPKATKGVASVLSEDDECYVVGAGCATSFIAHRHA